MRKLCLFLCLWACAAGLSSLAGCAPTSKPPVPATASLAEAPIPGDSSAWPAEDEASIRAANRLKGTMPRVAFEGIEFQQVLEFLREATGVSFDVNWTTLRAAGIDRTAPTTVKLMDVSAEKALRVVLAAVGGAVQLGYLIDEGAVTISTKEDLSGTVFTRVYDIRDIVLRSRPTFSLKEDNLWSELYRGNLPAAEVEGNSKPGDEPDDGQMTQAERTAELMDLIRMVLGPVPCIDDDDALGSISDGQLIITQTYEGHRLLKDLLEVSRNSLRAKRVVMGVAVVRLPRPAAGAALRKAVAAGASGLEDALRQGVEAGRWSLDRCAAEELLLGEMIVVRSGQRSTQSPLPEAGQDVESPSVGYAVQAAPIRRDQSSGQLHVALATFSGRAACPAASNQLPSVRTLNNALDVSLLPGEAKLVELSPAEATDGGIMVVLWRP